MSSGGFKSPIPVTAIIIAPKRVCWNTETDWNKGTIPATMEVSGTGNDAFLRLKEIPDNADNIPFTTVANYTVSSASFIEVAAGLARLKSLSGESADFPFTTPSNFTLSDGTLIKIINGSSTLRVTNVVGHWFLNESSGTNAADASGNGNDGTTKNMEDGDWVAGKLNNALQFDGVDEWVDLGAIADFERTDSFSLEFWFKTATSSPEMMLTKQENSGNFRGWNVFIENGVITTALISVNGSVNRLQLKTNSTFNDDVFHHCVITYNGSSSISGLNIFIDGSDVATTTVTDNLSSTIANIVNTQISGRAGANVVFNGIIDEVVIYAFELTSAQVTTRYNSGTGTQILTGSYPTSNPTVVNNTGFVFTVALDTFTETSVKPSGTALQYHVSSDNGVTWEYWDGAIWTVTDDSFAQSNTAAVIQTNLPSLAASGTFKFRALLNSDATDTPELDRIQVSGPVTFSTNDDLYVETKNASQINPTDFISWLSIVFTSVSPASTDIRILFSQDSRVNWLTWSGSAWVAPSSPTTRTDAATLTDAVTNFAALSATKPLDVRVFLRTTDDTASPSMDNILANSDAGFDTAGTYLTNIFDSTFLDLVWAEFLKTQTVPVGTITVKGRANNSATAILSDSFGPDLVNGAISGLTGEFVQLEVVMTGDGTDSPTISLACLNYQNPVPEIVAP